MRFRNVIYTFAHDVLWGGGPRLFSCQDILLIAAALRAHHDAEFAEISVEVQWVSVRKCCL